MAEFQPPQRCISFIPERQSEGAKQVSRLPWSPVILTKADAVEAVSSSLQVRYHLIKAFFPHPSQSAAKNYFPPLFVDITCPLSE